MTTPPRFGSSSIGNCRLSGATCAQAAFVPFMTPLPVFMPSSSSPALSACPPVYDPSRDAVKHFRHAVPHAEDAIAHAWYAQRHIEPRRWRPVYPELSLLPRPND